MYCPNCKTKSATVAVGNEGLICAKCKGEVLPDLPAPKRKLKSKKRAKAEVVSSSKPDQGPSETLPEVAFIEKSPEQTIASAKAVANAWSEANKKWRLDNAHVLGNSTQSQIVEPEPLAPRMVPDSHSIARPSPRKYHLILVGLLVYLIGHMLIVWAFLSGNFGAWTVGNICSVGGVTLAIFSIVQALRDLSPKVNQSTSSAKFSSKRKRSKAA